NAGYRPASIPIIKAEPKISIKNQPFAHGKFKTFPARVLNKGNANQEITSPKTKERKLKSIDSVRNWVINPLRCEPTTLRKPTSFARLADFAVERLTKLMHAIKRMKPATAPNNQTKRISPRFSVS